MAKPKRRFFQFRLRTLLLLVALVSVAMSWFTVKWNQAKRQRAAVESISEAGGEVDYEYEFDVDGGSNGSAEPPGPTWLRKILGVDFFSDVHAVHLFNRKWTDAGLEPLARLKDLKWLNLGTTQVTDAGLEHVAGLKSLGWLWLSDTQVTDAGLEHVAGLKKLEMLDLCDTQVTDAGLEHLVGLKNLEVLLLGGTQVTDEGVTKLRQALPNCDVDDNSP